MGSGISRVNFWCYDEPATWSLAVESYYVFLLDFSLSFSCFFLLFRNLFFWLGSVMSWWYGVGISGGVVFHLSTMRLFSSSSSFRLTKEQSNGGSNGALLYLNVYDLTPVNKYLYWVGLGIFHSGIEGMFIFVKLSAFLNKICKMDARLQIQPCTHICACVHF